MNDNLTHPFSLEVKGSDRKPGMFEWTIRRDGKLIQRSDRLQRSEDDARKDGFKAIERQLSAPWSSR